MTENRISHEEALQFKIKRVKNSAYEGTIIGNTGLHFFNKENDWTWHYQPEGHNGPVKGKEIKYATIFLAAFGEFIQYWNASNFSNGSKPDLIQSLTNPTMATFLNEEFRDGILHTNNYYCVTFHLPAISANASLVHKFTIARSRCDRQAYTMDRK